MNKFYSGVDESEDVVNDEFDLRDLFFNYFRYWRWFILSVIVTLALGTLFYLKSDRMYEVSTAVLLKEDKGGLGQGNSPFASLQDMGLMATTNNVDNEIAVFCSPNLMKRIVLDLELYTKYFKKGFLRNTEVYTACPYYVHLEDKNPSELYGNILLDLSGSNGKVKVDGVYNRGKEEIEFNATLDQLPGFVVLPADLGRLYIALRPDIAQDDNEYEVYIANLQGEANYLAGSINITSTTKQSSVLNMNLNVLNVAKGVDILGALIKTYNETNVEEKNETARNSSKFIQDCLNDISGELKDVEDKVVQFKEGYGIADIGSEAKMYVEQTSTIEAQRIEIETQLRTIEFVQGFIKNAENNYKLIPNLGVTDPGLSAIILDYNTSLLAYENLDRSTNADSPSKIRTLASLDNKRQNIEVSIANVKKGMTITKQELEKRSSNILSKIRSIPVQERGLLEIMRQQEVKQELFLYLMKVNTETGIMMASTSDKAKIITDPVIPSAPISPKRDTILLASFLLGLIIPIMVIFLRDKLTLTIGDREELAKMSRIPIIGEIMKNDESEVLVVNSIKTTPIVELFRSLRNNVKFVLNSPEKKVILVASTVPGEGKTFVSVNLAASFSLSDKRVLLIGMDIRKPKLADDLGFEKGIGLTSYLVGDVQDWKSLLANIEGYSNLDILQAGTIPPNPNELLMRSTLNSLLEEARGIYDLIVIDSAPIGVVSDTFLIGRLADATIYVTRENVTPKKALGFVNEVYSDKRLPNMYMVYNGADLDKNKSRYGYGYTYGYHDGKK